jgi:uncharacterized iron-regulated protein
MAKGESKVIIDQDDDDCDSDNDDNALCYDDLVAMVIKSDDKLRMDRAKLRDLELKNVSLQNSLLAKEVKGKMSMGVECNILNVCSSIIKETCHMMQCSYQW